MKIVYAKQQFSAALPSGEIVTVLPNQPWDANSEFVKAHKANFTDEPLRVRGDGGWVEQATAAPGEKRKR